MLRRLRRESGFGLIELLIAMLLLNIAFLALLATFSSGTIAIRRAARTSTASSLADSQMELYRALTYGAIALDVTQVGSTDATYRGDGALGGSIANDITTSTGCAGLPNQCNPSRAVIGPDHGFYRVDTYITSLTPTSGRAGKLVTVVVRDGSNLTGSPLARVATDVDASTAS